jgi:glycosyltransferase involved in cell wall biosynthesis
MADQLTKDNVRVVIVGGRADHVQRWQEEATRRRLDNVQFAGFVAPSETLLYQMAADVLLLYYPSGSPLNDYRSPGKLFEYMASGTPAVVSDYLSIREVMRDGKNGLLVPPDRPDLLAAAVKRLLEDPALAQRLAEQAKTDAGSFTWAATAKATLSLVDRLWVNRL